MNPLEILQLAIAASGHAPLDQTLKDGLLVYSMVTKAKTAGRFDASVMAKDGTLAPVIEATARLLKLMDDLLKDPAQAPRVAGLLAMFS